ncbi:MAG: Do family serine endopeptidase, partial [Rhodospirillaceae bacterium]|nr:Do family serine endopeptidase [Rhodospirillaceae bacterium]
MKSSVSRQFCVALVAAMLVGPGVSVGADEKRVPASRADINLSFAPLVKSAAPAVVNIYTRRVVRSRRTSPLFNDPFFRRFFGNQFPPGSRQNQRVQNSLGSGVIVSADGLIVTNHHVIDKADEITVVLTDRREFEAEVVTRDDGTDLAVLRIKSNDEKLPFLKLRDSDTLEVGDLVLAIGNPFGVGQTVTSGIVSALARTARGVSDFGFFIQTDAAINPGNSGGALISLDGGLIGINTAIYSRGGGSNGIGFAIPSNMVATVIGSALSGGQVVRPWLGARGQTVDSDLARSLGLSRPSGVLINSVHPNGPAAKAGVKVGDVVVSVNAKEIADANTLKFRIATLSVGTSAAFSVMRRGQVVDISVPLQAAPEIPQRDLSLISGSNPYTGAEVANLSPALAEEISFDADAAGVVVMRVKRG